MRISSVGPVYPAARRRRTRRWLLAAALAAGAGCRAPHSAPRPQPQGVMATVPEPALAPFSSICRLEVRRRQVQGLIVTEHAAVATGALVDASHLLTAAHNFSSPPHLPVAGRAVECGRHGRASLWSRTDPFRREHLRVEPDHYGRATHDYAVVRVGASAPFGPGFRLPRPGELVLRRGDTVHVAGYAADVRDTEGTYLYHGAGPVRATSRDSTLFAYDVETRGGMSGSPVWVVRPGPDGRPEFIIVGVHVGRHPVNRRMRALARTVQGHALASVQGWLAADSARH